MPDALPNLDESQIQNLIQEVAAYIESQRQTYRDKATPLDQAEKAVMAPFFPPSVLYSARVVVLSKERVSNPPFYPALVEMGFDPALLPDFTAMGAITFGHDCVPRTHQHADAFPRTRSRSSVREIRISGIRRQVRQRIPDGRLLRRDSTGAECV
jgi:hypothetical protein